MSFGENLKRILKQNGMTQKQLADRLGVTRQSVCWWINGVTPHSSKLPQIAEALGCSVQDLYGDRTPYDDELLKLMSDLDDTKKQQLIDYGHFLKGR